MYNSVKRLLQLSENIVKIIQNGPLALQLVATEANSKDKQIISSNRMDLKTAVKFFIRLLNGVNSF